MPNLKYLARKFQPAVLRERFETSLWVIPVIAVLLAISLAEVLLRVDGGIEQHRQAWLEDRFTRFSMGLFVGSFTYAMVLLPELRTGHGEQPEFVPAFSVFVAFVLVLLCVGVFVHYIHHMAHSAGSG